MIISDEVSVVLREIHENNRLVGYDVITYNGPLPQKEYRSDVFKTIEEARVWYNAQVEYCSQYKKPKIVISEIQKTIIDPTI